MLCVLVPDSLSSQTLAGPWLATVPYHPGLALYGPASRACLPTPPTSLHHSLHYPGPTSFIFFYFLKFLLIYLLYVNTLWLSSDTPEEGVRSCYGWLWATIWLLGFELMTFRRAVSALNCWAISPAPSLLSTEYAQREISGRLWHFLLFLFYGARTRAFENLGESFTTML